MRQFSKKSMKFLAMLLVLSLTLPISTPAFAWCCPPPPRRVWCCPPPPPPRYYYSGCYYGGNSAAWGFAGFTTGVIVGSVITSNQNRAEQQTTPTVTRTETLPLILHKF